MKDLVDRLIDEKQKLFVKGQLRKTYERIDKFLNQDDIEINQLDELKYSINNIIIQKESFSKSKYVSSLLSNVRLNANDTTKRMLFLDDCLNPKGKWAKNDHIFTKIE